MKLCPTTGKESYTSRPEARKAAQAPRRRGQRGTQGRLHAFKCPACSYFHVGHRFGLPHEKD